MIEILAVAQTIYVIKTLPTSQPYPLSLGLELQLGGRVGCRGIHAQRTGGGVRLPQAGQQSAFALTSTLSLNPVWSLLSERLEPLVLATLFLIQGSVPLPTIPSALWLLETHQILWLAGRLLPLRFLEGF